MAVMSMVFLAPNLGAHLHLEPLDLELSSLILCDLGFSHMPSFLHNLLLVTLLTSITAIAEKFWILSFGTE